MAKLGLQILRVLKRSALRGDWRPLMRLYDFSEARRLGLSFVTWGSNHFTTRAWSVLPVLSDGVVGQDIEGTISEVLLSVFRFRASNSKSIIGS